MKRRVLKTLLVAALCVSLTVPATVFADDASQTEVQETVQESEQTQETESEAPETEAPETEAPETEAPETEAPETEAPEVKKGLVEEDGKICYYENGVKYTGGLKAVTGEDGTKSYYYFKSNGNAYTSGELTFTDQDGKKSIFYFGSDGKAFTGGLKSVKTTAVVNEDGSITKTKLDSAVYFYFQNNGRAYNGGALIFTSSTGKMHTCYFQGSGQAYTKGYKATYTVATAEEDGTITKAKDGEKHYFYFLESGFAQKGLYTFTDSNDKSVTYYFQKDGEAYTDVWKKINGEKYYFKSNGKAAKGYQTIDDENYYFQKDGTALKGWKKISDEWHYFSLKTCKEQMVSNVVHTAWSKIQDRTSGSDYYVVVDTTNTRTMTFEDYNGTWVPKYDWICTPGKASTPTVKGTFTVYGKGYSFGSGYTCYYYTQFHGNYLFHSIIYNQNTFTVQDGRLGQRLSHGCVRLALKNAKWFYNNLPYGTKVLIYGL